MSVLVVLMLLLTFGLGYWTGFSHTQNASRVIVAMDTADSQQSSGKVEYEPYFTKQNQIPSTVK